MAEKNEGGTQNAPEDKDEMITKLSEQVDNLNKGIATYRDQPRPCRALKPCWIVSTKKCRATHKRLRPRKRARTLSIGANLRSAAVLTEPARMMRRRNLIALRKSIPTSAAIRSSTVSPK